MQYEYERFTPDRFQEFCQALLVNHYPDTQCFPVGQKDGGRDATSGHGTPESIVFQVKFKRDRLRNDDGYKLIKSAIDGELEKIKRLAAMGATRYVIMTNIAGTSAAQQGTMDKIQKYLDSELPIPGQVWWRADLDARLNNSYDLKWTFSEVVTSSDIFRMLISEGLGESSQSRFLAIKSYLAGQYEVDKTVKFKQAELQASALLSLFIDVPINVDLRSRHDSTESTIPREIVARILVKRDASGIPGHGTVEIGGASLLLHSATQSGLKRIIIEGAPGQGKSTLTQYVCQVHRMRILGKDSALAEIPEAHRELPARIPFKVDLRDLSTWLQRKSPFTGAEVPASEPSSVESFLAHQIKYHSGGHEFGVNDLNLMLSNSPALLFFDGLDEVATLDERKEVVEAVNAASARIEAVSPSSQIIVTSRPAATPNTPRFSPESWTYLSLSSIKQKLIYDYTERWGRARNLSKFDIAEIKSVLAKKLESSHLKDLARNAMQLTILLNLVHVRGQALPDHRTSLYDSYVEVFFNRESDKSRAVREHRQLLVDLHGFLAWKVQADAEVNHTNGRITHSELRTLIADFLSRREHDSDTLNDLIDGVVQRIVALVSRVEGTFEFEVQPLREYFAARHLYDTAPYSPSGNPQQGTKPEIFESIAPNPFWLNTTRFYAGCYSVGELAGLAEQVDELLTIGEVSKTSFPRTVATSLLSDRVFSQKPQMMRKISQAALDPLAFRYAARSFIYDMNSIELDLPVGCGREIAIEKCIDRALHLPNQSSRIEAGRIFSRIGSAEDRFQAWSKAMPSSADDNLELVSRWLWCGIQASIVSMLDTATVQRLSDLSPAVGDMLLEGGHEHFNRSASLQMTNIQRFANGQIRLDINNSIVFPVVALMNQLKSGMHAYGRFSASLASIDDEYALLSPELRDLFNSVESVLTSGRGTWRTSREHWDELILEYRRVLGETWFGWQLAVVAIEYLPESIVSSSPTSEVDVHASIDFVANSIRHASESAWWTKLLTQDSRNLNVQAALMLFLKFAKPAPIRVNLDLAAKLLDELSPRKFGALLGLLTRRSGKEIPTRTARALLEATSSARLRIAIASRCSKPTRYGAAVDYSLECGEDEPLADYCLSWLANDSTRPRTVDQWRTYADACRRLYAASSGELSEVYLIFDDSTRMSTGIADQVLDDCDSYPEFLVNHADRVMSASARPTAVRRTASNQNWAADE